MKPLTPWLPFVMLVRARLFRSGCFDLAARWEWWLILGEKIPFFFPNWRNSTAVTNFLQHFSYFQICQRLTSEGVALSLRLIPVSISAERNQQNVRFCLGRPKPALRLRCSGNIKVCLTAITLHVWCVSLRSDEEEDFNNMLLCFFSPTTLQARCPGMLEIRRNNEEKSPSSRQKETWDIHISCAEIMCRFLNVNKRAPGSFYENSPN